MGNCAGKTISPSGNAEHVPTKINSSASHSSIEEEKTGYRIKTVIGSFQSSDIDNNQAAVNRVSSGVQRDEQRSLARKHQPQHHDTVEIAPHLETLNIQIKYDGPLWVGAGWEKLDSYFQFESCPNIKTLNIPKGDTNIRRFNGILRVFPNLTKLTLGVGAKDGPEIMRQIFTHMTRLESLTIQGTVESKDRLELDSIFTGFPAQSLRDMNKDVKILLKDMAIDQRSLVIEDILGARSHQFKMIPSITNLTNLRRLEVNYVNGGYSESNLSDFTGYLALYPMQHLSHLELDACVLTKECCQILTKEIALDSWSFRTEYWEDIVPPFPLREKKDFDELFDENFPNLDEDLETMCKTQ